MDPIELPFIQADPLLHPAENGLAPEKLAQALPAFGGVPNTPPPMPPDPPPLTAPKTVLEVPGEPKTVPFIAEDEEPNIEEP